MFFINVQIPAPFITRFASGEETDLANPLKGTVIRASIEAPTEVKSVVSILITSLSREQVRHSGKRLLQYIRFPVVVRLS
jgi:hypothetical protein